MNAQSFQPEAVAPRIEDSFLPEEHPKGPADRFSEPFLEGAELSRKGSLEDSFLRDADRMNPNEGESFVVSQSTLNKEDGCRRENEANSSLANQYPERHGFQILPERYLLDQHGSFARDPLSGESRRIDFVVVDREYAAQRSIEVTSPTAPKDEQIAKEDRIRAVGGTFIRDPMSRQLIDLINTPTEILRIP